MKKTLALLSVLLFAAVSLFSEQYRIIDAEYSVKGSGFSFLGKTRPYVLRQKFPLDKKKTFNSREELESYINNYEETLISSRDFESVTIDYESTVSENEVQSTQRGITWLGMTIVAFISLIVGFIAGVCLSDSLKDLLFDDNVKNETPILKDEPLQKDSAQIVVDKKVVSDSIKDSTIVKPKVSKPIEVQSSEPSEPEYKKYEKMDSRVLHGAYYIMGTASVVKTKKDDTSDRLSRRYLGNGMACYIEVYNGINASTVLPEGQDIKIPKLEWKKNVNKKNIKH